MFKLIFEYISPKFILYLSKSLLIETIIIIMINI